ncbi:MAG: phage major capsid protein, partial [Desulfobacteraceae bacterium]|nr:phage major capsid protein [Desulfobacteraceae bacterium]
VSADYLMDGPNSLAGYPLVSTQNVPTNQIAFGKWSDLILGMFGPLDVLVNPYESTAYTKGNVQVRLMQSCDVAVRHAESFCIADLIG